MPIRGATSARSRRDLPQSPALTLGPNADESRMRRHGRSSSSHLSSLLLFFILGPLHLVIRSGFSLQPPSQSSTRRYSRSVYQEENGLLAGCKTESSQSILTRHSEWGFPFCSFLPFCGADVRMPISRKYVLCCVKFFTLCFRWLVTHVFEKSGGLRVLFLLYRRYKLTRFVTQ